MKYIYKNKLVELREEKNIKQYTLAQYLNFHKNAYGQFEREDTILPINHLNKICNYFNVSIDYIFSLTTITKYKNSKNEIDNNLAAIRLKEFRKENNLSQEKLANYLTMAKSSISKYEKGNNLLPTIALHKICKKYKISADYLLGKIEAPKYLE